MSGEYPCSGLRDCLLLTPARPEALSIYEFLIALDLEVSTAWQRKKTVPSVLLLTIRWVMLANGVVTFVPTPSYKVRVPQAGLSYPSGELIMQTGVSSSVIAQECSVNMHRCIASAVLSTAFNVVGFAQAARTSGAGSSTAVAY